MCYICISSCIFFFFGHVNIILLIIPYNRHIRRNNGHYQVIYLKKFVLFGEHKELEGDRIIAIMPQPGPTCGTGSLPPPGQGPVT